tara:strand:- start:119 stop:580 length:462 start_codon:yes stop_codon:yes gene_type:complete
MSETNTADREYMLLALTAAQAAETQGEVPVGAVVVIDNKIVTSGFNRTLTDCDPTAHAEMVAIRKAAQIINNHRLTEATLFVTLEPCAMCMGALIQARIKRLVFGAYDPKAGAVGSVMDLSNNHQLNHTIEVDGGVLEEECSVLLKTFFKARR